MLLLPLFFSSLVAAGAVLDDFVAEALASNGVIKLDSKKFDLLTPPDREWSATVQLTALGANYKCTPCQQVSAAALLSIP